MKTLKDHRNRLLLRHVDLSSVLVSTIVAGRTGFTGHLINTNTLPKEIAPEHEALWFYMTNHATAALSLRLDPCEPLGPVAWVFESYHERLKNSTLRMFYYLLQICTRESRHAHNPEVVYKDHPKARTLHETYKGTNADTALARLDNVHQYRPDLLLGEWTRFLVAVFYKCSYNGGYGGKKWGAIADVLNQFAHGEITGEMMLDTAWTLCHNNGPIFNKGMWYQHHSSDALQEILDVQRAGMIPALVAENSSKYRASNFIDSAMRAYAQKMAGLSADFSARVDWAQVMKLGSVGSYKQYLTGPKAATTKVEQFKQKLADKKAAEHAAWVAANSVFIDPSLTVVNFKPVREEA